jgi:exportin-2 (importin alpha re-exporter)
MDRKTAVISLAKTLTDSAAFASKYKKGWAFTCEALLKLLENPPVPSTNSDDVIADHDVDDMSFGVGFTQLSTTRPAIRDPWPEVTDVKLWVSEFLRARDKSLGGRLRGFADERLSAEVKPALAEYLRA